MSKPVPPNDIVVTVPPKGGALVFTRGDEFQLGAVPFMRKQRE